MHDLSYGSYWYAISITSIERIGGLRGQNRGLNILAQRNTRKCIFTLKVFSFHTWQKYQSFWYFHASVFITGTDAAVALPTMPCCRETSVHPSPTVPPDAAGFDGAQQEPTHAVTGMFAREKSSKRRQARPNLIYRSCRRWKCRPQNKRRSTGVYSLSDTRTTRGNACSQIIKGKLTHDHYAITDSLSCRSKPFKH